MRAALAIRLAALDQLLTVMHGADSEALER
jgi:hypothetical protein